jgi:hypothetical protein
VIMKIFARVPKKKQQSSMSVQDWRKIQFVDPQECGRLLFRVWFTQDSPDGGNHHIMVTPKKDSYHHWILPRHRRGYCRTPVVGSHPMIRTMHKFFASRAGMRPDDPKDRNPRNFNNGSNLNWRSIFLFVAFASVVLGLLLFSRNGSQASDGSFIPRVTTGNTMAPCVIIGERAGEILKAGHKI